MSVNREKLRSEAISTAHRDLAANVISLGQFYDKRQIQWYLDKYLHLLRHRLNRNQLTSVTNIARASAEYFESMREDLTSS